MYDIGDYVVKVNNGICRIESITHLDMDDVDKNKLFYLLVPQKDEKMKIYVSVDNAEESLRKTISEEEAWKLIRGVSEIEVDGIINDKQREQHYKQAIRSCKPEALVSIIKDMYARKIKRSAAGKKNTATDEHFFKVAEDNLYSELAFAIGKKKDEICRLICDIMDTKQVC